MGMNEKNESMIQVRRTYVKKDEKNNETINPIINIEDEERKEDEEVENEGEVDERNIADEERKEVAKRKDDNKMKETNKKNLRNQTVESKEVEGPEPEAKKQKVGKMEGIGSNRRTENRTEFGEIGEAMWDANAN